MSLKKIEYYLSKINDPISKFGEKLAGILLVIMTIVVLLQVFFRYIFSSPLSWTDEISCYLMIYMTYLCMPIIYLENKNISMTFIIEKIEGKRILHFTMLMVHILALFLFIIWIYFGWLFFLKGNVMANSLPFSMYYIYIAPPVLFSVTTLSILQKIASESNKLINFKNDN